MSELYMMTTIAGRTMLPKFLGFYQEQGVNVNLITLGRGQRPARSWIISGWNQRRRR